MALAAEPGLKAEAERFDTYVNAGPGALCRAAGTTAQAAPSGGLRGVEALLRAETMRNGGTLPLSTPPISAALCGGLVGGEAKGGSGAPAPPVQVVAKGLPENPPRALAAALKAALGLEATPVLLALGERRTLVRVGCAADASKLAALSSARVLGVNVEFSPFPTAEGSPPTAKRPKTDTTSKLDPVLRRLGYHCNRLCALQPEACAYFLGQGGLMHRLAPVAHGGRVDAAPGPLPGWPADCGALATLIEIRNAPDFDDPSQELVPHDPTVLLASDGAGHVWICDDGGDCISGAPVPLPLPPGSTAAEGWSDWLVTDASWSTVDGSAAGRVDCALLGCRPEAAAGGGAKSKCWCVLSAGIVLPSPTTGPQLHGASVVTADEPLYLRCAEAGCVRCLMATTSDQEAQPGLNPLDAYSAVELRPGTGADATQLTVATEQRLDGWRPLASPGVTDLSDGAALLCGVQQSLSILREGSTDDQQQRVDPHAHVFDWREGGAGGATAGLLRHEGFVGALGYICSARPQRRFVCVSRMSTSNLLQGAG